MSTKAGKKAELKPILDEDVTRTAQFLHRHMNDKFSTAQWERGLRASWYRAAPHHGFMLEWQGEVVGAICTLYSEQEIDGEIRVICNPHTWCVLEPYRSRSVSLILAVIRQPDLHFTMFSPNADGEEIFAYLGFKPLPRDTRILVNVPTLQLFRRVQVGFEIDAALPQLSPADRKCVTEHRQFAWLRFVFYSRDGRQGFLIYKTCRYKRLPGAHLIHISDRSLFEDCWPGIRTRLLLGYGICTATVEQRLLGGNPTFSFASAPASAKFYLSDTLPPEAFKYTYSELVALDL